jgi:hypothetical protein
MPDLALPVRICMRTHLLIALVTMIGLLLPVDASAMVSTHRSAAGKVSRTAPKSTRKPAAGSRKSPRKSSVATRRTAHGKTKARAPKVARKPRYAYPVDFFMWETPQVATAPLSQRASARVKDAFISGMAGHYSPEMLVRSGVFTHYPLKGGIFNRREPVKHIIIHSTETERPADGPRVIRSWNHGRRHPGAQFVVDRDGTIYQAVNPDYGTVHVDIFRTLYGVNNDNSIGIEIVRSGKQKYTAKQLNSTTRLVAYLQERYGVIDEKVLAHSYVQPSTRRDPVNFNWDGFIASKSLLRAEARKQQPLKLLSQPWAAGDFAGPPLVRLLQYLSTPSFQMLNIIPGAGARILTSVAALEAVLH